MLTVIASIGFAIAASPPPPSGPKAVPEDVVRPKKYEHLTQEPPGTAADQTKGILQYDLDSAYLPDVVGGYLTIDLTTASSTITAEQDELLRQTATFLKERADVGVWVTAVLTSDTPEEARQTALGVESVVSRLKGFDVGPVPYRIFHKGERRPPAPQNTLEVRVISSVNRPVS